MNFFQPTWLHALTRSYWRACRSRRHVRRAQARHSIESLEPRVVLAADLVITEFQASNQTTLADGDGNFSDWIEIHNPTTQPVSLDGWYLTDDADDLTKWPLPDVELSAGQYWVVFASSQPADNYVDGGGNYHTNFSLAASGEDLALVEPDGVTFDPIFLNYPEQSPDLSYGLSIDGITETLVAANAQLAYRVPSPGEDATAWTAVNFDDSSFTHQQTVAGSGLLITEVDTGDTKQFVEIQNVSAESIDTSGWVVALNNPASGVNGVVSTVWNLDTTVSPGEILYRTDQVTDNYWGSSLPWQLEGPGWVMIVDDTGAVQDFAAWGYDSTALQNLQVTIGSHSNVTLDNQWVGGGAAVGGTGVSDEPIRVGSGADLSGATGVDSAGVRLNVEPTFVQTLPAGTYNVQDISFAANSDGTGELLAFLAIQTAAGPTYQTIWVSSATRPAAGDSIHTVPYAAGSQQFTLTAETDVYAGAWHDGAAKVRFSSAATITNHDSSPITPSAAGETIGDFSHPALNDRTYAYHITVAAEGGTTSGLARTGAFDSDSASNFQRTSDPTPGAQNPDSQPLFGGIVPTIAGLGFSDDDPLLNDLVQTNVGDDMRGTNASAWTRFEFSTGDLTNYDTLALRVRYDDGFQAYLDGVPIAARNAPTNLTATSWATAARTSLEATAWDEIDVSEALAQLTAGDHVLAFHVLNVDIDDADLLLKPQLLVGRTGVAQFFADPTPGQASTEEGFNTVSDTKFSVDRGFYDSPFNVTITSATSGAKIVYTRDGSPPTVNATGQIINGLEYVAPIAISGTTTLRAMAFKSGLVATDIDTHTYVFTSDVARQTYQSAIDAGYPTSWGRTADYGMDPDVVGPNDAFDGVYAVSIAEDLKALPTLSLVLDANDMFGSSGIYSNIGGTGQAWERPVSAELIYPDGTAGFQINAGIRAHGGASRSLSRKNSLRLLFKEQYGPTKLNYPLFGDGVDSFDTVVLRAHFNDGWGWDGAGSDPLFARDEFHRQTQAAMGHVSSRGMGVHLYINGMYWGIYNPSERPDASFAAQHLGGAKEDWDAINHGGTVDGSSASYNTMLSLAAAVNSASTASAKLTAWQRLQGNDPNGNDDPAQQKYLDVENYIDYLMLSFYTGNDDWPTNNWYAARRRGADSEGYQFFAWDSEIAMDLSSRTVINENTVVDTNNNAAGAAAAYGSLRNYSEFQLAFADRVHQHFFNGGVFYVDPASPQWDATHPERNVPAARMVEITDAVRDAVVAESARWGDQHRSTPYTRNAEWQSELDHLLNDFFPQRSQIVMGQLRANNLYPNTDAPEFLIDGTRQHGGTVNAGDVLSFENSNGAGTIWYTTDGSDPRLPGGAVNTASATSFGGGLTLNANQTLRARILLNGQWSALSEATFVLDQSGLRISEVHYNPATPTPAELAINPTFDNDDFEFIEIVNVSDAPIRLEGVQFVEGVQFAFSQAQVDQIEAGQRVVVVSNLAAFSTRYDSLLDDITIAGEYSASLSNSGETLRLIGALGDSLAEFTYDDGWYSLTDGEGYSLTVRDVSVGDVDLNSELNWRPSQYADGSPGSSDVLVDPGAVVINELLATSNGQGWIELYNPTTTPIDVGHWFLSDAADDLRKYQFASNTIVPARGYLVVQESSQFGLTSADPGALQPFTLPRQGGHLYLTGGDSLGRLLGYREDQTFTANEVGTSLGIYTKSTGATDFVRQRSASPGARNAGPTIGPLVISEVMYHPDDEGVEFIELQNIASVPVTLPSVGRSWRLRGAIDVELPVGLSVPAGSHVLLVQTTDTRPITALEFRALHNVPASVPIVIYSDSEHGSLNNDGEKIFLEQPVNDIADTYLLIDAVNYNDAAPWPIEPDGGGPSLSRIAATAYGNDVANWGTSTGQGTPGRENIFEDTTPPSVPTDVIGRLEDATTASIAWGPSVDAQSGIDHYRIYRNGQMIGTSQVTRFTDLDVTYSTAGPVRYVVTAINGDGLESDFSATFVEFGTQSISFQQGANGYAGARDAEIREGAPNANNGLTDTELEVDGEDGGTELSILLGWKNLSVPSGSVIVGASITVSVLNPGADYAVHQLLRDWNEGEVTWNQAAASQTWATAGARGVADRGSRVGTLSGGTGDLRIDLNDAGVAMVQSWVTDPSGTNFGVVIANPGGATDGADLYSREHSTVNQRPKLSLLMAPTPAPSMPGDFNLDESVDAADLDLLFAATKVNSMDPAFDLDSSGIVDQHDFDYLLHDILHSDYGDANLDGVVDGEDLGNWMDNRFQDGTGWATADFNGDGLTDGKDFNAWLKHRFSQAVQTTFAVHAPQSALASEATHVLAIDTILSGTVGQPTMGSPRSICRVADEICSALTSVPSSVSSAPLRFKTSVLLGNAEAQRTQRGGSVSLQPSQWVEVGWGRAGRAPSRATLPRASGQQALEVNIGTETLWPSKPKDARVRPVRFTYRT
ncbi:MAG: lamin tail domain-containing protein [Planctomycetales bacterium]|nr:lamin tail domain-containing protein [Planctomycetales bacterium]